MSDYEPRPPAAGYPRRGGYPPQDDYPPQGNYPPGPPPNDYDDYGERRGYDPRYRQPTDPREQRAAHKAERARAKAMRPWYQKKRWWIVGGVVAVIVIAAVAGAGGSEDDGGTATDEPASDAPSAGETEGGQDVYAIGETANTGDFDVTVHAVEDPFVPTNEFEVPAEGQRFVGVEATVTNTSDQPLPFSTLAGVELFDQADRPWAVALAGTDRPQLDAPTVAPGEARRGWVVFSVPPDATELTLRVKGNLTATGSLFQLSGAS
jgi:Domain of unknown function (DUF4352)